MKSLIKISLGAALVFAWSCRFIPMPVLTSISPDHEISTLTSFTLLIGGADFQENSRIYFNNRALATTFVSAASLSCVVSAADMTATTSTSQVIAVPVYVNTPDVGNSNSMTFSVCVYPSFLTAVKIADSTSSYSDYIRPLIEIDNAGRISIVWRDQRKLFFTHSADGGATWRTPFMINEGPAGFFRFSLAVNKSSGIVFVAWEEGSVIYLTRSTNLGLTWSPRAALSNLATVTAENPGLFVDSTGAVFLAYAGRFPAGANPPYAVTVLKSTNHGTTFLPRGTIGWHTYFTGDNAPEFGLDKSSILYLVFPSDFGTRYSTNYLAYSGDNGLTWSTPVNINLNAPAFALDAQNGLNLIGANMYLPYMYKMTFKRSTDRGATWVSRDFADTNFAYSDLVVNAQGSLDAIWKNEFVRSGDRGATWFRATVFTDVAEADRPTMVEDAAGRVYIAWWNTAGGIYFTRSQ